MFKSVDNQHDCMLCPHCDLVSSKHHDGDFKCPRCNSLLSYKKNDKKNLFFCISAIILFIFSLQTNFIQINIIGIINNLKLTDIFYLLSKNDNFILLVVFGCLVLFFPVMSLLIQFFLLSKIKLPLIYKKHILNVYTQLQAWTMPEIFLAGVLVSFVKLVSYGEVNIEFSFWVYCFFIYVYIKAHLSFSKQIIWDEIKPNFVEKKVKLNQTGKSQGLALCKQCGFVFDDKEHRCPRCAHKNKKLSLKYTQYTGALVLTACLFYIPANVLGVMETMFMGDSSSQTIIDGVLYMWGEKDYPVAIVIFSASVFIPLFKILGLSRLCFFTITQKKRSKDVCNKMMKLYLIIEHIGKWSMIDVFVIIVLSSLIRNGQLMTVFPYEGILYFSGVVILTMVASSLFDTRLIWNRNRLEQE